jgi:CubicO group peptidase (beta-lactamase class C family)
MHVFRTLLFAIAVAAQPAADPAGVAAKVDGVFARYNHTDTPGCTVGVAQGGRTVLEKAYGMADLEHGIALATDSILEAGSVSKQFTAAAVLLLAEEGKLTLDDPVRKYIPELPDYGTSLTIRQMLNHTSGLRDWGAVAEIGGWPRTTRAYTHAHVLEILSRQKSLNYAPGAEYSYSNSGYNLAAILVSRVAGMPFAEFTREKIFEPMGMRSTSWRDDHQRIVRKRAVGYADQGRPVKTLMPFEFVHGNGGLLTTTADLLRWNENFTRRVVGGPGFVEAQLRRARLTGGREIHYAAGLMVESFRGEQEISHSGSTAGYRAWLARYPKHGLSVALLCNAASANPVALGHAVAGIFLPAGQGTESGEAMVEDASFAGRYRSRRNNTTRLVEAGAGGLKRVPGRTFERVGGGVVMRVTDSSGERVYDRVAAWRPGKAELEAMAGEYRSEEAEVTLKVFVEGQRLVAVRRPGTRLALTPRYEFGFETEELGSVRFLRNGSGEVTGMSLGSERVWDLRLERTTK